MIGDASARAALALLVALTPFHALAATDDGPASSDLSAARALRDQGRLPEAAVEYERIIAQHPTDWEPRYEASQVYLSMRRFDEAERHLQSALLSDPNRAPGWSRLGQIYLLKGDAEKAEMSLRRARDLNPSDAGVHYNLGKLYEKQSRDAETLTEYTEFARLASADPRVAGVRLKLVLYYENTNQLDKVTEQYRALAAAEPNNVQFVQGLADSLYKQSLYEESMAQYMRVVQLDPNSAAAWFNIGFIQKTDGKIEESERSFRRSDELSPGSAKTLYQLGYVKYELGDFTGAAAAFEKVIALEPDHSQAHYHYSRALAKLGKIEESRRELQLHQSILRKLDEEKSRTSMERP